MSTLVDSLRDLEARARGIVREGLGDVGIGVLSEEEVAAALSVAAGVSRLMDAVLLEAVGEAIDRSDVDPREARLTSKFGCRSVGEFVERTTRLSSQTAARLKKAAKSVRCRTSVLTGERLEPFLPGMRDALLDGVVGLDGVLAVAGPFQAMDRKVPRADLLAADAVLAAEARGEGPDAAPPACADLLHLQAQVWATVLDQDGARPRENQQSHRRGVTLGSATANGVPIRGTLMPEVAAQLQRIFDASLSPKVEAGGVRFRDPDEPDDGPLDFRTRAQRQHDALANALSVAASSGLLPTIGGAAPTLIVSVRAQDAANGTGYGFSDGCSEPISPIAVRHVGCAGVIQRVTSTHDGRIVSIGIEDRVFNRHQRRAIARRDGGCIIPGCGIPAGWCEIHHVVEHARGGPTHTDNGVLLCWYHHRFLETSGWAIRMSSGVPEVRAPGWYDATLRWRPVTTSRTRMLDAVMRT